MRRVAPLFVGLSLLVGCTAENETSLKVARKNGVACNPMAMAECALPIPSSFYEIADADAPSGRRLNLPAATLPASNAQFDYAVPFDPTEYNRADGWSPATSIFVDFEAAVDEANLVPYDRLPDSLGEASPTVILDAETGERVAHFAEVDKTPHNENLDYTGKGLLLRPAGVFKRGHRYIVAITSDLKRADGKAFTPPSAFAALRDGSATDDPVIEGLRKSYGELFSTLEKAGLKKEDLLIAWDFHTASDEYMHRDVLAIRAKALAAMGDDGIGYTMGEPEFYDEESPLFFRVAGTFTSPLFLADGGSTVDIVCNSPNPRDCPPPGFVRGDDGLPVQTGQWERPFVLTVPKAATEGTLPIVQFGHGLLGGGGEIFSGYNKRVAQELGMAFIATDWTGLSTKDVPIVAVALGDFNFIPTVAHRLVQGLVDNMALTRTIARIAADERLKVNGHPAFTAEGVTFYGISLGGIQGGSLMALSPDLERGVLNVPGSTWSLMFQRSSNWNAYSAFMKMSYPHPRDRQTLLVLSQTMWDYSDPIAYAPHVIADPFPGQEPKKILYQEAVNDSQVPNIATEKAARAMGIPLLVPTPREVWGLEEVTEAESALTIWDESVWAPIENIPPESDNRTHGSIRDRTALKQQIDRFLFGDGLVVDYCGEACVYERVK